MRSDLGGTPPLGAGTQQVIASREAGLVADMAHDRPPVFDDWWCVWVNAERDTAAWATYAYG
jgi:hypothetical protein